MKLILTPLWDLVVHADTNACDVMCKCSDVYGGPCDGAIAFDDPDLQVGWVIDRDAVHLSAKDVKAPAFAGLHTTLIYEARI